MPGPGAFEWSTPAEAQTKPWRVSVIRNGGRARTIRAVSLRTTSTSRGSRPPASSTACGGGLDVLDPHDAALGLRDGLLRDDDDVAVLELRPRRDQRAEVVALLDLGQALRPGRSRSRQAGDADAGVALVAAVQVHDHRRQALERARARERAGVERAAGDELRRELERELLRIARRRRRRTRPRRAAPPRGSRPRSSAGRRRPAPSTSSWTRSASERASGSGRTPDLENRERARDREQRRRAERGRRSRAPCRARRRP